MPPATENKPAEAPEQAPAPQQVMDVRPPEPAPAAADVAQVPKTQPSADGLAAPPPETDPASPTDDKVEQAKPTPKPKPDRGHSSAAIVTTTLIIVIVLAALAVFAYTKSTS